MPQPRLSLTEVFGLKPYGLTLEQARMVFLGDPSVPPSRFDLTSLHIVTPRLSVATWFGKRVEGRTLVLLNLFNRTQTPIEDGWSVRVTQVRDFRGRGLTYDSHNGTDFVIPPGTTTVSAAPGRIVSIRREWNRGGLKVYIDHGGGLMTTHNHLGRALVRVGDLVERGQPVALTAYSGIDGVVGFPLVAPHVHYNVIHGGVLVDPFAQEGEVSLWRDHNDPRPYLGNRDDVTLAPTEFAPDRLETLLESLRDPVRRAQIRAITDPVLRGWELVIESTIYPTRFSQPEAGRTLFETPPERRPWLDMPFSRDDYACTGFADDLGYR